MNALYTVLQNVRRKYSSECLYLSFFTKYFYSLSFLVGRRSWSDWKSFQKRTRSTSAIRTIYLCSAEWPWISCFGIENRIKNIKKVIFAFISLNFVQNRFLRSSVPFKYFLPFLPIFLLKGLNYIQNQCVFIGLSVELLNNFHLLLLFYSEGQWDFIVWQLKDIIFHFGFLFTAIDLKVVFSLSYDQRFTTSLIYNRHSYKLNILKGREDYIRRRSNYKSIFLDEVYKSELFDN